MRRDEGEPLSGEQAPTLSWPGKEAHRPHQALKLSVAPQLSFSAKDSLSPGDQLRENLLIHGDCLDALMPLRDRFEGQIRCVYLDPPFNTRLRFAQYRDILTHGQWLSMLDRCVTALMPLLREDGSLWVHLDDRELHYMKVLLDERLGRENYVASVVWQRAFARKNKALISSNHDTILIYAKSISAWRRNLIPRGDGQLKAFKNPDDDPRGPWQSVSYSVPSEDPTRRRAYRYPIALPSGGEISPPKGRHWNGLPERTRRLIEEERLWFGLRGDRAPRLKLFLSEAKQGLVPGSWWPHQEVGHTQEAKREQLKLFPQKEPFATPKPERLLKRIIEIPGTGSSTPSLDQGRRAQSLRSLGEAGSWSSAARTV